MAGDARSQLAGIAALEAIAAGQAGRRVTWRDRRRIRAEVRRATAVCACTCERAAHEHFRPGSDCGRCGKAACPAFRRKRSRIISWRRS